MFREPKEFPKPEKEGSLLIGPPLAKAMDIINHNLICIVERLDQIVKLATPDHEAILESSRVIGRNKNPG